MSNPLIWTTNMDDNHHHASSSSSSKKKKMKKEKKEKNRLKSKKRSRSEDNDECNNVNSAAAANNENDSPPPTKRPPPPVDHRPNGTLHNNKDTDNDINNNNTSTATATTKTAISDDDVNDDVDDDDDGLVVVDDHMVVSSALEFLTPDEMFARRQKDPHTVTLLLFYQYVEPPWSATTYTQVLEFMNQLGSRLGITGRMRVAKEGLNCTLTTTSWKNMLQYCHTLRNTSWEDRYSFTTTEFKLTRDLPQKQAFPSLKVIPVTELVHYGLDPHIPASSSSVMDNLVQYTGTHLEPKDYHEKLAQDNTVVIDVRNHYEANIGRFVPPNDCQYIDPLMRKSTEFPFWLQKPETREALRGKQVLMYCTGGVRCERATALLKYKMETDESIKSLNIQGVFQLQGGIDKYFREFPDGGYWQGKNYTFDKRFAHAPAKVAAAASSSKSKEGNDTANASSSSNLVDNINVMGQCEACGKPWDMYRGKRRCPTCGVPSLICRECFEADKNKIRKLDRTIRCDLCVEEGITSKAQLRAQEEAKYGTLPQQQQQQPSHKRSKNNSNATAKSKTTKGSLKCEDVTPAPNPDNVTRLHVRNLCRTHTDEESLVKAFLPHSTITHIAWRSDHRTGQFLGQAWVEMKSPLDAAHAVARGDGQVVLWGRPVYVSYQPPDGKDRWPPPHSAVARQSYDE